MAALKPFKGIRPDKDKAHLIASPPYDVVNKEEAREQAKGNPLSFLHIIKPEIDLPDNIDPYSPEVYNKGKEYFCKMFNEEIFFRDEKEHLYIYAQTVSSRTQYGIVGCASAQDYMNGLIKKHELTRPDKVEDRKNHIRVSCLNYEPVFLAYRSVDEIDEIVAKQTSPKPEYDFTSKDGVRHRFWIIEDKTQIKKLVELFKHIPYLYVADGHHRTEAAASVGDDMKKNNPHHKGNEEYNYFLAVLFPDNQLKIQDYNRVVKDLNGLTKDEFLKKLNNDFVIEKKGAEPYKPDRIHNFGMYLDSQWYSLTAKVISYDEKNLIESLDVTILSNLILAPVLGITDLRKSERIDFVGGIKGLGELKRRVDSGEMSAGFALYPVSMMQLMAIADEGNIMPPKTTWFEPKLGSGLILHSLS